MPQEGGKRKPALETATELMGRWMSRPEMGNPAVREPDGLMIQGILPDEAN